MKRQAIHQKIYEILIPAIAILLPFVKPVPFFTILLFLNWLVEGDFKNKFSRLNRSKIAWLFIGYYLLLLIGMLWTENFKSGLFDLEVKLSIIVFPIIFTTQLMSEKIRSHAINYFISGCLCVSLFLLTSAYYDFITKNVNHFFYTDFSTYLHPSYLSMFINIALAWVILNIGKKNNWSLFSKIYFSIPVIIYFSFIVFLLSSRAGFIGMILTNSILLVIFMFKKKKIYAVGIVVFFVISVFYLISSDSSVIVSRGKIAYKTITSEKHDLSSAESTNVRFAIASASKQIISDNFIFGVGTGDAKDALINEYSKNKMTGALEHKFNAHNQFLQTAISIGILGLCWFLALFVFSIKEAIRKRDYFYLTFLMLVIFNFLFESMLETQAGVMIFGFISWIFLFDNFQEKDKSKKNESKMFS